MGGGVAGHPLQAPGGVDELAHPLVAVIQLLQLGRNLQGLLQGNVGRGGNQLGHHIGFREGEVQRPTHIPDGAPGGHGAEGCNLCHVIRAILAHDVLDDLAPALLAEIRIKIRHAHPFRV